jgi:hypothetical protein
VKHNCAICGREREDTKMDVFKVKESENSSLSKMSGGDVPLEVAVCKPCARLMSKKETALQIFRGTIIAGFRSYGVSTSKAEAVADAFCKRLADATPNTPVS